MSYLNPPWLSVACLTDGSHQRACLSVCLFCRLIFYELQSASTSWDSLCLLCFLLLVIIHLYPLEKRNICTDVFVCVHGGNQRQAVGVCSPPRLMWVLGTKQRSSGFATSAFTCWASLLTLYLLFNWMSYTIDADRINYNLPLSILVSIVWDFMCMYTGYWNQA